MRRVVMLFLDGLRRDMLTDSWTPNLWAQAARSEFCDAHRSMFPSATRVVSASIATGCVPARHELQGNSLALLEDGKLVAHDAGHPDFLQHKRRVTGRSLAMPTIAERVKSLGGAAIYANVSPGAAYAHDPDGHGTVFHRAGTFGPGRTPVEGWTAKDVPQGIKGDWILVEQFIAKAVLGSKPAFALLWCAEPDVTQHAKPLGSPEHLAVLTEVDRIARRVMDAVDEARAAGDDILFIVGSDHGHQTVSAVIDIDAELISAGLKQAHGSGDVMAISSGTSALIYVHETHGARISEIGDFLRRQPWTDQVLGVEDLHRIGQTSRHGLAFAVSLASTDDKNPFGIPGMSYEAKPGPGKEDHLGCGQHGGLAPYEQMPFLLLSGKGFRSGGRRSDPTSALDVAPTILTHLGLRFDGLDGRALQNP